jgi:hypothetical protein
MHRVFRLSMRARAGFRTARARGGADCRWRGFRIVGARARGCACAWVSRLAVHDVRGGFMLSVHAHWFFMM